MQAYILLVAHTGKHPISGMAVARRHTDGGCCVGAAEAAAGAAEQQVQEARACAAEEVKRRQELVQTHAAELAQLQRRLQAAQV